MPAFVISYVPNVENVDNVERVRQVDNVGTVQDVRKLPHPYFPLKQFNYQYGGSTHITATQNTYQSVYIPEYDCEFKGVHLCFTSYNIEDTYDIMIGSRYICRGSHVKEMSEYRMFEVYEDVTAGTPIVIVFHNNSGLEKWLLFDFVCLFDQKTINFPNNMEWDFNWQDTSTNIAEQEDCVLIINQPNYVNMDSTISSFSLNITDIATQESICTISCQNSSVSSDYAETETQYMGSGYLARSGVVAITSVSRFDKSIQIVFRNISDSGTTTPHSIEMNISGLVNNIVSNF